MSDQRPTHAPPKGEPGYWLDEPKNVDKIFWGLVVVCAALVMIDLFLHRHTHYSWEALPGFYGIVGFAAFWCIVIIGKHLRKILMRDEDYYDR